MSCNDLVQHIIHHAILGTGTGEGTVVGSGNLLVKDEGTNVGYTNCLNFSGADVLVTSGECITVYIPPPSYDSHWNTSDGDNGAQTVSESISRSSAYISSPSSEGSGTPFRTGGWAESNQDASVDTTATFTTPGTTTGFGGDSTVVVTVYNAVGTVIDSYTTPAITGNAVHTSGSGNIVVTITSYAADSLRYKANASVAVDIDSIFTTEGESGGRYHVKIDHVTDSTTDGGTYTYTQDDVFLDTNATTPSVDSVGISETSGSVTTKHLSGIEYYTIGSEFTATVSGIDQLNRNTARTSQNLRVEAADFGLATLQYSPFGTGSANFSGWTSVYDQDSVTYQITDWAISDSDYRFFGTTANASARADDTWNNGSGVNSSDYSILVDTYGSSSTDLFDDFDDEDYRLESDYSTSWDSTASLSSNEGLVQNSYLMVPDQSTLVGESSSSNTDWSGFLPNAGGANPDYSSLTVGSGVSFYRNHPRGDSDYVANMTFTFAGDFNGANALEDLVNEDLQVFVRKIAGIGNYGPASPALLVHGDAYNFGTFDDGNTDGQIRLGSSSGNTINCTFGTFTMQSGIHVEYRIANNATKLDSVTVSWS